MSGVIVGAVVVAGASVWAANKSSKSADKASNAASNAAQLDRAESAARYKNAEGHFDEEGAKGEDNFNSAIDSADQSLTESVRQNQLYQGESSDYKNMAKNYENKMLSSFDKFLDNFGEMFDTNAEGMKSFESRYGPIMDNMSQAISDNEKSFRMANDISGDSLASQGREQLSQDMSTLQSSMTESMAARGIGRSGILVESEQRLAASGAQQARAIDVHAEEWARQQNKDANMFNQQANQFDRQHQFNQIQSLNGMQGMEQGIRDQKLGIQGQVGSAHQALGGAYGMQSSNFYNASQNMFGKGFGNVLNAQNNKTNLYNGMATQRVGARNSFYSGVAAPNSNAIISSLNNQANAHQADAGGFMKLAGTALGSVDWGKTADYFKTTSPTTSTGTQGSNLLKNIDVSDF